MYSVVITCSLSPLTTLGTRIVLASVRNYSGVCAFQSSAICLCFARGCQIKDRNKISDIKTVKRAQNERNGDTSSRHIFVKFKMAAGGHVSDVLVFSFMFYLLICRCFTNFNNGYLQYWRFKLFHVHLRI